MNLPISGNPFPFKIGNQKIVGGQALLAYIREAEDEVSLGHRFQEILEHLGYAHYFYTLLNKDGCRLYLIHCTYPDEVRHF
ncbi:MAG: hypothetical protein O2910_06920 [Proteobacteria bacterium]|nr:hypothetical protein [Pseudomonadota bacterium]